jgi:hypothetical protein
VGQRKDPLVPTDIEVRRLINFETATDGTVVRLLVDDVTGCTVGIIFTIETRRRC